jgi:aliphatic sulfonates family ABC transporter substrate-binding protein
MPVLTLPNANSLALSVRAKALVFEDPRSRALLERIQKVAPSEATVLITGETGTGKEIVARHVHELSRRPGKPFVAVNCGAFSENLAEAELFGHERGAFTGAQGAKAGWFEAADGGTLFLDEIGDLSLPLQVKLLRVLQEGEVVRIGSRQPIPIDVRLIAATNVDLRQAMAAGHFREDLFYRLNVSMLQLPALRERPGDILPLAEHFLEVYRRRLGVELPRLTERAALRLVEHPWPGNIRELENAVHHALLVCKNGLVSLDDLGLAQPHYEAPLERARPSGEQLLEVAFGELFERNLPNLYEHIEAALMRAAYNYCHQNQLQTARLLGVSRNVVRARLIQFGEIAGSLRSVNSERGGSERGAPELAPARPGGAVAPVALERARESARQVRDEAALERAEPKSAEFAGDEGWSTPRPAEARDSERPPPSERRLLSGLGSACRVFRVGYQKFGLLTLVKLHGALDAALARMGVRIEWREYPAGLPIVDALRLCELEVGVVGECPPLFAQADQVPLVYLAAEEAAPEREAILVHEDSLITSVRDLPGKSIVLQRGANVHYLVIRALEEAGVEYQDVRLSFAEPEFAKLAFARREVDAWAIWDPVLSAARYELGARVLRNGTGLAKNVAYYVARRPFMEAEPEIAAEFVSHVSIAGAWARDNATAVADLLAPELGVPRGVLALALRTGTSPAPLSSELILGQQQIADTLHRMQLIPRAIRVAEATWTPRLAG